METVKGYVEHIVFRNEDNGYTVFNLNNDDGDLTCVGNFNYLSEGELVEVNGEYVVHSVYGTQLRVLNYEIKAPEDLLSIERYLGSGAIKGVGASLAGRIVKKFREDTFRIIEEEPERLAEVRGISERMAREIAVQVEEKKDMRKAMIYLQKFGISTTLAAKIYQFYGPKTYQVLEGNPYQLADQIQGIGFKIADEIATKIGIHSDSDFRIPVSYTHLDSAINDEIDKLRHSATAALSERNDVIIVASVSCIYGLGSPIDYKEMVISLRPGMIKDRDEVLKKLVEIQYDRNDCLLYTSKRLCQNKGHIVKDM